MNELLQLSMSNLAGKAHKHFCTSPIKYFLLSQESESWRWIENFRLCFDIQVFI